ncbi:MAG: flippase-like domain-containing protein [Planctomycetes bacterium]|nr:flippase-like domain-containing protein [Planctomycetota bacterium]
MKGVAVKVLKLLLVAALIGYVCWRVHWEDRLVFSRGADPQNAVVERELVGDLVGSWQTETVSFQEVDASVPVQWRRGAQQDGTDLDVVPGLITYWKNLHVGWFAAGAFCYFLTVLIAGTRWWWLLRVNGMNVTLGEALRFTWIGTFFNNVMLGATGGDVVKAIYIMKRCPGHRVPALVSVIVDRVLGLASLAILGAVVVLFALDRFGWLAGAIWGVMGGVLLLGLFAFSKRLRQLIRLKDLLEKLPHKISHLLKLVDQAVFFYRGHKRTIAMSLLAGVGNHVISVLSVVFIGDALGVGMPWMEYFVLIPVINIVSALPVAPNGWGWGEALYQQLFAEYGKPYLAGMVANPAQTMGTRGVALSVLYRLHITFWSLLGGLLVLFDKNRVTRADIAHEADVEATEDVPAPPEN